MVLTGRGARGISSAGLLAGLLVLAVAVVCIRLGLWQLDRLEQRRALNEVVASGMSGVPIDLNRATIDSISREPASFVYRPARVTGRFEGAGEILLRGRSHEGAPGVHLVAPFRLSGDSSLILVNRGWLPSPDGATADPRPFRDTSSTTLEGLLQVVPEAGSESVPATIALPDLRIQSYRRLDRATMTRALGTEIPAVYLQVSPSGRDRFPIPVPPPSLDEGPHLGYAIQWFGFAAVAVIGFFVTIAVRRPKPSD